MRNIQRLAIVLIGFTLCQCSTNDGTGFNVTITPRSPVLFTSDATITTATGDVSLNKNWFRFALQGQNNNSAAITIMEISYEVRGLKNGELFITSGAITATAVGLPGPQFVTIPPGQPTPTPVIIYLQGISTDYSSKSLVVTLTLSGFYGTIDNPLDRFTKLVPIVTQ